MTFVILAYQMTSQFLLPSNCKYQLLLLLNAFQKSEFALAAVPGFPISTVTGSRRRAFVSFMLIFSSVDLDVLFLKMV